MPNGERFSDRADRAVTAAAMILGLEAVSWLCYSYRFVDAKHYFLCCGAGQMFGYLPMRLAAAAIIGGSVVTLGAATLTARGRRDNAWVCWSVSVLGVLDGAARVVTPTDWRSEWVSEPPLWFTIVARGWPTLVGCLGALVLMVYSSVLVRRGRGRAPGVDETLPGAT